MQGPFTQEMSLFYVYAPEDRTFCEDLDKHLGAMKRQGWIRTWYDRDIEAGQIREQEIERHLSIADIILLLISADFLASDACYSVEMKHALRRHEMGEAVVVPIIVRPVDWNTTPFCMLKSLPTDGKAIVNWPDRDQAFLDVTQGLRLIIEKRKPGYAHSHEHLASSEHLWTVPYRQNRFFIGRESILEQISSYFSSWKGVNTPIVALSGLGGIGKTQIALEYAYRSSDTYQAIFWMNASSHNTLMADFVGLAASLSLLPTLSLEPNIAVSMTKRWLSDHHRWLLILDTVSEPFLVSDVIPLRSSGHVLLTTQAPTSRAFAYPLEIDKLSEQNALELLLRRAGLLAEEQSLQQVASEDVKEAQHVCLALDGLPLALDQAGAYIEETGCSLAEYNQRYQQQQLTILSQRGSPALDHPASIVTTWSLSFEHLEPLDPHAADLLRGCAFLAPEIIPQQIFIRGAAHLGPHLASFLTDEAQFDAAVKTLRRFSLIRRFPHAQTLSLHRLVQVVLRSQMELDVQTLWAERIVQAICAVFPHKQDQEWARCSLYIPHVYVCEKLLDTYHLDCPATEALFYRTGRFFHEHAQYAQAEYLYQRALSLKETAHIVTEPEDLAKILDSLGWLALDQGRFSEAEPFFQHALTLKESMYGCDHVEIAITLHARGRLAHAQYRYKDAEALYLQALQIKEHAVGDKETEIATTLHALGWLLHDQRCYDTALPYYQKAFAIRSKVLGMEHVSTAITLNQLARLAHHQKQYAQAEKLYHQSLLIKERTLVSEHPFTATAMDGLARLYQDQGRPEEAEAFYQRALAIREHYFGPEHLFTAEIVHHLACLYQNQRQLQQAEAFLLRALNIREQVLGPHHLITAISIHQLARLFSLQQRWKQAEELYQQALAIREQAFGLAHPSTQSVVKGYIHLLRSLHRDVEAQDLEQRSERRSI